MKIAIIGYGKMGQMVERLSLKRGHQIVTIQDPLKTEDSDLDFLRKADVAIEFTRPDSAIANYFTCFSVGLPVVSGTTGWLELWDTVAAKVKETDATFFYASNFSLGVNLVFKMNEILAKLMADFPEYRSRIVEIHHEQKADAPSGTAISLANQIIAQNKQVERWVLNQAGANSDLPVFSVREGIVPGIHDVSYISNNDKISLRHEAFSREGFATGAVLAAEFLMGKKGIFTMNDLLAV